MAARGDPGGGGGVRPGRGAVCGAGGQGAGEEPAGGRVPAGCLGGRAGLDLVPGTLLHPSVTGRFARACPGLSGAARRTHRTNLRFIARRVVPHLHPAGLSLPRERAKAPYGPAEIEGFLALAAAQPTPARRARAAGLVCLGAGAGLIRGDLREVREDSTLPPGRAGSW